jgi:hypothetical protein
LDKDTPARVLFLRQQPQCFLRFGMRRVDLQRGAHFRDGLRRPRRASAAPKS